MKYFTHGVKLLLTCILALTLSLCSDDNDDTTVEIFEPVTLNLAEANVTREDTMFMLQGFMFRVERAESSNGIAGILLAFPSENGDFSTLELDLTDTTGISKMTISLFNNCSNCLDIQVFNENQIVTEVKGTALDSGSNLLEIEVDSPITSLKIGSAETIVTSIKLE